MNNEVVTTKLEIRMERDRWEDRDDVERTIVEGIFEK